MKIKLQKFETVAQAEWRYFLDAVLHNKNNPKDVIAAMTNAGNIRSAKEILNRKSSKGDKNQIAYLNSDEYDAKMKKLAKSMSNHDGFIN